MDKNQLTKLFNCKKPSKHDINFHKRFDSEGYWIYENKQLFNANLLNKIEV